jgi:hypothetical protein
MNNYALTNKRLAAIAPNSNAPLNVKLGATQQGEENVR